MAEAERIEALNLFKRWAAMADHWMAQGDEAEALRCSEESKGWFEVATREAA